MKRILHIISSARGAASESTRLGNRVVERLLERYPGSTVTLNNVVDKNYEHLRMDHLAGFFAPPEKLTPELSSLIGPSDEAVKQLVESDIVVISVAMYNFNLPSALKAWIDHIVRAGKTFTYKNGFPEGLLQGQKVYLAIASSGVYSEGAMKQFDFAEPYLRYILGFLGVKDFTTFRIEGQKIPGVMETAVEKGLQSVSV